MSKTGSLRCVVSILLLTVCLGIAAAGAQAGPAAGGGAQWQAADKALLERRRAERVQEAVDVHERYKDRLAEIDGVVGSGVGLAPDGEPSIKVFTARPGPPGIPDVLEGVAVRQAVSGRFHALRALACDVTGDQVCTPRERWPLPVPIGVSVGHPDITAGTLGARVTDGANVLMLSNNHVLADSNLADLGDMVIQPGRFDGGTNPGDAIAALVDFEPIRFCTQDQSVLTCEQNSIDAAVALTTPVELGVATPRGEFGSGSGYGVPLATLHPAYGDPDSLGDENLAELLGVSVQKYGRTSGLTAGVVDSINVSVNVCYDKDCASIAHFTNQLIIIPGSFSAAGDSGSLVVDSVRRPVGLLFAGGTGFAAVNRIDLVLRRFAVRIDDREPPAGAGPVIAGHTTDAVTDAWYPIGLPAGFADEPLVVTALESFDGGDTAGLRLRNVGTSGFEVKVEEEQSRDTETWHTTEVVGYLALAPGAIPDAFGAVIGEAGRISSNQTGGSQWRTIDLQGGYANPVVLMSMLSYNGDQPAHIRLRNVTGSSFQYQIEEWDYLDQSHLTEALGFVVLERGSHVLPGGRRVEVGAVQTSHLWYSVAFSTAFSSPPIVLTQCQTLNGGQAVVTRQKQGTSSGFEVRLQEEEGNDGTHAVETLGYVAVAP